jgi:hypothetical protein
MTRSWVTRISASFSAIALVGGMAFLTGCNDCDDCDHHEVSCDDCHHGCSGETVINTSYESQPMESAPVSTDYRPADSADRSSDVKVYTGKDETVPASDMQSRRFDNNINVDDRSLDRRESLDRRDFSSDEKFRNDLNANAAPAPAAAAPAPAPAPAEPAKVENKVDVNVDKPAAAPAAPEATKAPDASPAPSSDFKSDLKSDTNTEVNKSSSDLNKDQSIMKSDVDAHSELKTPASDSSTMDSSKSSDMNSSSAPSDEKKLDSTAK